MWSHVAMPGLEKGGEMQKKVEVLPKWGIRVWGFARWAWLLLAVEMGWHCFATVCYFIDGLMVAVLVVCKGHRHCC
jgi:hypothetical protein